MLIDQIYQNFPELSDLRMRRITVEKYRRKVNCELSYPDAPDMDKSVQRRVIDFVKQNLPQGYTGYVSFVNDAFSVASFQTYFSDLLREKYPVFSDIGKDKLDVTIVGRTITLVINVGSSVQKSMDSIDFLTELQTDFAKFTCYNIDVRLNEVRSTVSEQSIKEQEKLVHLALKRELLKPSRYFNISDVQTYIGKKISAQPMYISDLKSDTGLCVVCGTIRDKKVNPAKNNPGTQVCKFVLEDETGHSVNCVLFERLQITDVGAIMDTLGKGEAEAKTLSETRAASNDAKMKKLTLLANGTTVAVRGKAGYSGFSNRLELIVYDVSKCRIRPLAALRSSEIAVPSEYSVVFPQSYSKFRQLNLDDAESQAQHTLTDDKIYTILYANSTGDSVVDDKLLAICAVKIVNGNVTEKLFTYINPERTVDDKLLEDCKIVQSKLIFYPTLTEIIADLYKFLHGSTVIGPAAETVLAMLNYYAQPLGYVFDNEVVSQHYYMTNLLTSANVKINPNNIGSIAKKCKVPFDSASFCGEIALTVAQCICVLTDKLRQK